MTDNSDLKEEILVYLGKGRSKVLKTLTKDDWTNFSKLRINPKKSYFVKGSPEKLKKFEAYFLFLCAYRKPLFKKYLLEDYVQILSSPANGNSEDLNDISIDKELILLYMPNMALGFGNTDGWVTVTILKKVANRNRQGNTTLILSERNFFPFQNTPELISIDIGGSAYNYQCEEIVGAVNASKEKKSEDGATSSSSVTREINPLKNSGEMPDYN